MNRETIIQMAREAGFPDWWINPPEPERQDGNALDMLTIFIELAKAEEREECAKVCDDMHNEDRPSDYAYAIRSRGEGV